MALRPCKECGEDISTRALKCPRCGAPRQLSVAATLVQTAVLIALLGLAGWFVQRVAPELQRRFEEAQVRAQEEGGDAFESADDSTRVDP